MRQTLKIIILVTFGYILGWASSVWRFGLPPLGRHHRHFFEKDRDMFANLDLSEEQRVQIQKIRAAGDQQRRMQHEKLREARRDFEEALDTSKDIPRLTEKFTVMSNLKAEMERTHFANMMQIHQILTLEQIKKLAAERPKGGRGRGGPFGPGPGPGGPFGPGPGPGGPPPF